MASRLLKELKSLQSEAPDDVELFPADESNLFHWIAFIYGPKDTPFEAGTFQLDIEVPSNYPIEPPKVKFVTKIFHPNIHFKSGEICLDLLKNAWSAVYTLQNVCRAINVLLSQPEPESPLNCDAGNLLRCGDKRGYNSMARMYTRLYASRIK